MPKRSEEGETTYPVVVVCSSFGVVDHLHFSGNLRHDCSFRRGGTLDHCCCSFGVQRWARLEMSVEAKKEERFSLGAPKSSGHWRPPVAAESGKVKKKKRYIVICWVR